MRRLLVSLVVQATGDGLHFGGHFFEEQGKDDAQFVRVEGGDEFRKTVFVEWRDGRDVGHDASMPPRALSLRKDRPPNGSNADLNPALRFVCDQRGMDGASPYILPIPPPARAVRVMLLDDGAAQRRLMRAVLSPFGLDVVEAASGAEALQLCAGEEGEAVSIVLVGWHLPDMSGPDFCRAFRDLPRERYAHLVLMTAKADRGAKAEGLEAGADDFVSRPVDMAELRARVHAGLRLVAMQENLLHRNHDVATMLASLREIQDATDRDLAEARRLQRGFLPDADARYGAHTLCQRLITQGPVGGDLLGHFDLGDGRVALYAIDVSGHGIASALMTGRLAGLFSTWTPDHNVVRPRPGAPSDAPHEVLARIDRFLLEEMETDIYCTAVLAYVDLTSGAVELCQAGHPHPLIRRLDGQIDTIGDGGPPIGLVHGARFEACTSTLAPGDTLLLHSDGVTECADSWGDLLGEDGLHRLLAPLDGPPSEVIGALEAGLRDHAGIAVFEDDVSMSAFRFGDGK